MADDPSFDDGSDVRVVHWPAERELLAQLASAQVPRLVIVDPSVEPPESDDCTQDWVWAHTPHRERIARAKQVRSRASRHRLLRPRIDDYGVLRYGDLSVALGPKEHLLARALVDRFDEPVPRAELGLVAWGTATPTHSAFATRLTALRRHLDPLGLYIQKAPSGYRLTTNS